jgi:hypothetical protein
VVVDWAGVSVELGLLAGIGRMPEANVYTPPTIVFDVASGCGCAPGCTPSVVAPPLISALYIYVCLERIGGVERARPATLVRTLVALVPFEHSHMLYTEVGDTCV